MIKKLERKSLVEQVYSQMEAKIVNGDWAVGSRIPTETELMESFGVSRNTLREAIRALVQVGLLETKQGDGTFVISASALNAALQKRMRKSDHAEIMEVRHALEREAAFLACLRRTEQDLEQMEHYGEQCRHLLEKQDLEAFVRADWNLHKAVVAASHNQLLIEIHAGLFEEIQLTISGTMGAEAYYDPGHRRLLEAIRNQDVEKAVAVVDDYIQHFQKSIETKD